MGGPQVGRFRFRGKYYMIVALPLLLLVCQYPTKMYIICKAKYTPKYYLEPKCGSHHERSFWAPKTTHKAPRRALGSSHGSSQEAPGSPSANHPAKPRSKASRKASQKNLQGGKPYIRTIFWSETTVVLYQSTTSNLQMNDIDASE